MRAESKSELVPALRLPEFQHQAPWLIAVGGELFDQISNKNHDSDLPILAITQEQGAVPRDHIDYHVTVSEKSVASYKVVEPGDFIISLRSFQGGIEFSKFLGLCSPAYVILRLRGEQDPRFFKHLFKTQRFIEELSREIEGVRDGKMVSYKQFSTIRISTPVEYSEMERVADVLDSVDRLIETETEKLDALKDHKQGLILELFPIKGETLPKRRFPGFQDPEGWVEKPLGEIAHYENGKAYEKDIEEDGDFVVVNARFISTDGEVLKFSNERYCIASKGDVLMVLSDLPKGRALAKCFLVDEDEKYAVNQRVSRLTAHSIESTFLYYALDRHPFLLAFNDGLNQTHLSKGSVLECPIAFPLDKNEQAKIVATLKAVDEQIRSQAQKVERLQDHKQGLLQQLFPVLDEVEG